MKHEIFDNLSMIAAVSNNSVLGLQGPPYMPWARKVPRDMHNFTKQTTGNNHIPINGVIMGRVTWETIPHKFKPLPNRENLILSKGSIIAGLQCFSDIGSVLDYVRSRPGQQFWVIGGNQIYKEFFPYIKELHLTRIHATFSEEGGNQLVTCIPEFMPGNVSMLFERFHRVKNEFYEHDEDNMYSMTFEVFRRKQTPYFGATDVPVGC